MDKKPTCYEVLGITTTAPLSDIQSAYRKLAHLYHPDKNATKEAEERMKDINFAFTTLADPVKRKAYDESLLPEVPRPTPPAASSQPRGAAKPPPVLYAEVRIVVDAKEVRTRLTKGQTIYQPLQSRLLGIIPQRVYTPRQIERLFNAGQADYYRHRLGIERPPLCTIIIDGKETLVSDDDWASGWLNDESFKARGRKQRFKLLAILILALIGMVCFHFFA